MYKLNWKEQHKQQPVHVYTQYKNDKIRKAIT